jgi:RimJ/RimL family protein N-acetyltransferase
VSASFTLRAWTAADREPFAALNADPRVMEFLPRPLTRAESDALADRIDAAIAERGWGLWALDAEGLGFVGFVGLSLVRFELPVLDTGFAAPAPHVEVGWRLAHHAWGLGLATRAARQAVAVGFTQLGLTSLVSFTALGNLRSRRVMARVGLFERGCFEHPALEPGHPLRRHVLTQLSHPG